MQEVTPVILDKGVLISELNVNVRNPALVCSGVQMSTVQGVFNKIADFAPVFVQEAEAFEYRTRISGYPSESKSPI